MKNLVYVIVMIFSACSTQAQEGDMNCNQATPFSFVKKKLNSKICIPSGYIIVSIEDLDMNKDDLPDKVVKYFKDYPRQNGDTTFYAFYVQEINEEYSHLRTYGNLATLYFSIKDQDNQVDLKDSLLNTIKNKYQNFGTEPQFGNGEIIITFYTDAAIYLKFIFEYSFDRQDFRLVKKQNWFAPKTTNWDKGEELINELVYHEDGLLLTNFNMLDYLL